MEKYMPYRQLKLNKKLDDYTYAKLDDDSIYEGKKQIYINAINESLIYKNFFYNYEDKSIENNKNNNN